MIEEFVAICLVLGIGIMVIATVVVFLSIFVAGALSLAKKEYTTYERDIEETTEESEFDGLLGIGGDEDELFPPESDLGDDEN